MPAPREQEFELYTTLRLLFDDVTSLPVEFDDAGLVSSLDPESVVSATGGRCWCSA